MGCKKVELCVRALASYGGHLPAPLSSARYRSAVLLDPNILFVLSRQILATCAFVRRSRTDAPATKAAPRGGIALGIVAWQIAARTPDTPGIVKAIRLHKSSKRFSIGVPGRTDGAPPAMKCYLSRLRASDF